MKYCSACLPQNNLTCPICKLRGHSIDLCPDKWRRYHSTVSMELECIICIEFSNNVVSDYNLHNSENFSDIC